MSTNKAMHTPFFNEWTGVDKVAFEEHATKVQSLTTKPSNDDLLLLYGYFKQVTVGDNTTTRPGAFSFAEKYKWDAWAKYEGLSQDEAAQEYIRVAARLIAEDKELKRLKELKDAN